MLKLLIARSSRQLINACSAFGTALMMASRAGNLQAVRLLIHNGGDAAVMQCDNQGDTALHHAARCGSLPVMQELISAGGSELVERTNNRGLTAEQEAHNKGIRDAEFWLAGCRVKLSTLSRQIGTDDQGEQLSKEQMLQRFQQPVVLQDQNASLSMSVFLRDVYHDLETVNSDLESIKLTRAGAAAQRQLSDENSAT
jgi:ankyrin repeat protein